MNRSRTGKFSACLMVALCNVTLAGAEADLQLVEAAKSQNWQAVRTLLELDNDDEGVDASSAQADGATALHWAAFWNDLDTLKLLIDRGANVDAENDYGATPLWCGCANRHPEVVAGLLAAGANPNIGLQAGESVLMRCVHTGEPSAVRALLEHGADVNYQEPSKGQTALMWTATYAHPDVTRVLLEFDAAVDARTVTVRQLHGTGMQGTTSPAGAEFFNAGGFTPLLFAARSGDRESARLLLDAGADLHGTAADGNTALVVATMSGHGRLAEFLLELGADPDADAAGYGPLHAAVLRPDPELVRALVARGADLDLPLVRGSPVRRYTYDYVFTHKEKGATPFMLAAKYLEPEIAEILSAAGADPLTAMNDGTTALMAAVGVSSNRGTTRRNQLLAPELLAARWKDEVRVLDSARAVVDAGGGTLINQANRAGDTTLHGAANHGFKAVVDFLVDHGGDLDIENKRGTTPRQILERRAAREATP